MRVGLMLAFILLLTACGAQSAPAAAPATLAPLATATSGAASAVPAATQAAPATAVAPVGAAPVTPTLAQAATATSVPALTEYTAPNGDRVLGNPNAPITMLDYSDFQ